MCSKSVERVGIEKSAVRARIRAFSFKGKEFVTAHASDERLRRLDSPSFITTFG
jgi:hypothetical protein